jgi:hypothetical protein
MDEKPQYNLTLTYEEIALIKEVFDYEIDFCHETIAKEYLEDDEKTEWRNYLNCMIYLIRKVDAIKKILPNPLITEDRIEVLYPQFLEID